MISETATQDGKVGGPIRMAIITKEGCVEFNTEEIENINIKNKENSKRLKELFFGEEYGK